MVVVITVVAAAILLVNVPRVGVRGEVGEEEQEEEEEEDAAVEEIAITLVLIWDMDFGDAMVTTAPPPLGKRRFMASLSKGKLRYILLFGACVV